MAYEYKPQPRSRPKREVIYVEPGAKRSIVEQIDRPVTLVLIVLAFAGGAIARGFNIGMSLVTQDQLAEMKKYVDARHVEGLQVSEKYSDTNRLQTLNDMKTAQGALQSKIDSVAVKQDLMFDTMREMQKSQQQLSENRRK